MYKYHISISIQTLHSVLCWSTSGSDYSIESSWIWRHKLGTPVFGVFLPFFSSDPEALSGWMGSVAAQLFSGLSRVCSNGFKSGLLLGHSSTFRDMSQSNSCVVLAESLGSSKSKVSGAGFHEGSLCTLCSVQLNLDPDSSPSPCRWKTSPQHDAATHASP